MDRQRMLEMVGLWLAASFELMSNDENRLQTNFFVGVLGSNAKGDRMGVVMVVVVLLLLLCTSLVFRLTSLAKAVARAASVACMGI